MRKPRELRTGALYHVTARANRKEMILDNRGMKDLFLQVVARARKRYDFRIENFTLMGNHFHLLIRPGRGESLSRIMQWILSANSPRDRARLRRGTERDTGGQSSPSV